MELSKAIKKRHSVRQYKPIPIEGELVEQLQAEIASCNAEGGLHFQLILNEPKAFDSKRARYGKFAGVANYIAVIAGKDAGTPERCGYYGERLVLKAQQLGLHTCWVVLTYKKIPSVFDIAEGEKLYAVIAVGHGRNRGFSHKSKGAVQVANVSDSTPEWFEDGVDAALLAPTALNQQKFYLTYHEDGTVSAKAKRGFYTKIDLGIVKYHFEVAAGTENFQWR
jgi:hypothetical protein